MANRGPDKPSLMSSDLGWTKGDPGRKIWGLSHTHLANAIDRFLKDSGHEANETPARGERGVDGFRNVGGTR